MPGKRALIISITVVVLALLVLVAGLLAVRLAGNTAASPTNTLGPASSTRPKLAVLWAGTPKTALQHTQSVLDNFLIPNNAYVFAYLSPFHKSDRSDLLDGDRLPKEEFASALHAAWGDRLVVLEFAEDDTAFDETLSRALRGRRKCLDKVSPLYPAPFEPFPFGDASHEKERRTVDQYTRLHRLAKIIQTQDMHEYSHAIRMRLDVHFTEPTIMDPLGPHTLRVMNRAFELHLERTNFITEFWYGQTPLVVRLCHDFLPFFVNHAVVATRNTRVFTDIPGEPFYPETFLAAWLAWLQAQRVIGSIGQFGFGMKDGAQRLSAYSFLPDVNTHCEPPHCDPSRFLAEFELHMDPNIKLHHADIGDEYSFGTDMRNYFGVFERVATPWVLPQCILD